MGETVGHHPARRLTLQRVVADRGRRRQRGVDVAGFEEARPLLRLAIDPDAGETIGLQLDLDLQRIGFGLAAGLLLHPRHARQDAEQVLDVVSGLMRDDVGRREVAGGFARAAAEARLDLAEERRVEEDGAVRRTVERPHRRLRHAAAAAIGGVAEQHDLRPGIVLPAGLEDLAPAVVDFTQNAGDHAPHLVGGRAGLALSGGTILLVARRLAAAGENFRPADQDARVDAEGVAEQAEHDDGADAEAAAAHRDTEAAATHAAAAVVATVLDVVAAPEIIVTHGGFPSFRPVCAASTRQRGKHVKFPLR